MTSSHCVLLLLLPLLLAVTVEACSSTKKSVDPVAEPETTTEPATAKTHDVDWTFGMTQNELCVGRGDKVNFKYTSGHNVVMVIKGKYDACTANYASDSTPEDGPYTW